MSVTDDAGPALSSPESIRERLDRMGKEERTQRPIRYWWRNVSFRASQWWYSFESRWFRDRQRWLRKAVPYTYSDQRELIRTTQFAILRSFASEKPLEHTAYYDPEWNAWDAHGDYKPRQFADDFKRHLQWVTVDRAKAEEAWKAADYDLDVEDRINERDTEVLVWMATRWRHFWV